jgi:hypothetical protein
MGLSYAVHERVKQGGLLDGQFMRADRYVRDYHRYAFSLQNSDGSFSTDWFKGRAGKPDVERRLQTTGHILEWMAYSLPAETLDDPRLVKAVAYLTRLLSADAERNWSIGPLGHGLHGLAIYHDRRFNETRAGRTDHLARRGNAQETETKRSPSKRAKAPKRSKKRGATKTDQPLDERGSPAAEPPAELPGQEIEPAKRLEADPESANESETEHEGSERADQG